MVLPSKEQVLSPSAKGKLQVLTGCEPGGGYPPNLELLRWIQSLEVGLKLGTFLGVKGTIAFWKREHYQSLCWVASVIIIFISIKGILWQGIVKFNLVWIRTRQGLIFYFCPGLNLSWIIQCSSNSKYRAFFPSVLLYSGSSGCLFLPVSYPKTHPPTPTSGSSNERF